MSRKASKKWHKLLLQISNALAICKQPRISAKLSQDLQVSRLFATAKKASMQMYYGVYRKIYQQVSFLLFSYCGFVIQYLKIILMWYLTAAI